VELSFHTHLQFTIKLKGAPGVGMGNWLLLGQLEKW
jgi:hypothetical protein